MAKYHINHTKTERAKETLKSLMGSKQASIIIPRNKLDQAHERLAKEQKKLKYHQYVLVILSVALIAALIKLNF